MKTPTSERPTSTASLRGKRILVTGGMGLIGRNLCEDLRSRGYDVSAVDRKEGDLIELAAARALFARQRPQVLVHLAALVGGIHANSTRKAEFYEVNALINTHVVLAAREAGVDVVHAMGTGCAYPKRLEADLLREEDFLDGIPEPTNDAYAYAKRGLLVHLEAQREQYGIPYTYMIPANIFGPHDNFHPRFSHVVPGLIQRFLRAAAEGREEVEIWGTGEVERDFLYIADCTDALHTIMASGGTGVFNISSGRRHTIRELAATIAEETGFRGRLVFNTAYPDGQRTRVMSTTRMDALGWRPKHSLREGIRKTIQWCKENPDRWMTPGS